MLQNHAERQRDSEIELWSVHVTIGRIPRNTKQTIGVHLHSKLHGAQWAHTGSSMYYATESLVVWHSTFPEQLFAPWNQSLCSICSNVRNTLRAQQDSALWMKTFYFFLFLSFFLHRCESGVKTDKCCCSWLTNELPHHQNATSPNNWQFNNFWSTHLSPTTVRPCTWKKSPKSANPNTVVYSSKTYLNRRIVAKGWISKIVSEILFLPQTWTDVRAAWTGSRCERLLRGENEQPR